MSYVILWLPCLLHFKWTVILMSLIIILYFIVPRTPRNLRRFVRFFRFCFTFHKRTLEHTFIYLWLLITMIIVFLWLVIKVRATNAPHFCGVCSGFWTVLGVNSVYWAQIYVFMKVWNPKLITMREYREEMNRVKATVVAPGILLVGLLLLPTALSTHEYWAVFMAEPLFYRFIFFY